MSRTTRKKYRQRPMIANPVAVAIENASVLPRDGVRAAMAGITDAGHRLKTGDDADQAWRVLADAFNVAEQLTKLGICSDPQSVHVIDAAQRALAALMTRVDEDRSWAMHAAEVQAIEDGIERHAIQLQHCTRGEYDRAIERVRNRIRGALTGSPGKDAVIVGDINGKPVHNIPA